MKTFGIRNLLLGMSVGLLTLSGLRADDEKPDPIDAAMEKAMDADPSTAGMVKAFSDADAAWDQRMNAVYQKLKARMKSDEWAALVTAQKSWLAYRDEQAKAIATFYGNMEGTVWIPVSASRVMDLTKERAKFLQSLLDDLEERE